MGSIEERGMWLNLNTPSLLFTKKIMFNILWMLILLQSQVVCVKNIMLYWLKLLQEILKLSALCVQFCMNNNLKNGFLSKNDHENHKHILRPLSLTRYEWGGQMTTSQEVVSHNFITTRNNSDNQLRKIKVTLWLTVLEISIHGKLASLLFWA
jgi:hypothetical protein